MAYQKLILYADDPNQPPKQDDLGNKGGQADYIESNLDIVDEDTTNEEEELDRDDEDVPSRVVVDEENEEVLT